jgi:hypothetical protein
MGLILVATALGKGADSIAGDRDQLIVRGICFIYTVHLLK